MQKKSRTQKLKFENEIKIKKNPNLKKKKDEYQKMEEEIVKSLLEKKEFPLKKEEIEYEEPTVQNPMEIEKGKKRKRVILGHNT